MTLTLRRMSKKYNVFTTKAGFKPDQARDESGKWTDRSKVNDSDVEAIVDYTDEGYININRHLRNPGSWNGEAEEILQAKVDALSSGLKKMPIHSGEVWRGLDLGGVGTRVYGLNWKLREIKEITFKSFISTSKEKGFPMDILQGGRSGGKYLFRIISKTGRDLDSRLFGPLQGEKEVVFLPNTTFKVLNFDKGEDGIYYVDLSEK